MIAPDVLLLFVTASLALALAPGPDNIFVLTQSALYGRISGLIVTLGLCTGVMVHVLLVAFGVAAIFQTSAIAFTVLKFAGAGYLLYLAWRAFGAQGADITGQNEGMLSRRRLFGRGVILNVTNPKVAIFFLAFLPQFADPARGPVTPQILAFGAVFMICAMVVFFTIAWAAGFLGQWLGRKPRAQIWINRVAGGIFTALAVRLITAQR